MSAPSADMLHGPPICELCKGTLRVLGRRWARDPVSRKVKLLLYSTACPRHVPTRLLPPWALFVEASPEDYDGGVKPQWGHLSPWGRTT